MTPEKVRKVVRRHGKTLRFVAEGMGIKPQSLNSRLKAESLTTDTIESIANVLGISPAEFYEDDIYLKMREENERLRELVAEQMRTIQSLIGQKV
jgi:transcriptional regulator with XRE-family HTH domain